jgi:large subunit ribosomal protein L29
LRRLKEARFRLKFRSATEAIDNPSQFQVLRRNIARIETVLRERKQA